MDRIDDLAGQSSDFVDDFESLSSRSNYSDGPFALPLDVGIADYDVQADPGNLDELEELFFGDNHSSGSDHFSLTTSPTSRSEASSRSSPPSQLPRSDLHQGGNPPAPQQNRHVEGQNRHNRRQFGQQEAAYPSLQGVTPAGPSRRHPLSASSYAGQSGGIQVRDRDRERVVFNLTGEDDASSPLDRDTHHLPFQILDQLIEMEVERPRHTPALAAPQQQRHPTVIDLTEEPESPPGDILPLPGQARFSQPAAQPAIRPPFFFNNPQHRNPRRHLSQNRRTPSLSRSDASLLADLGGAPLIDLTDDSPHPSQQPQIPRNDHHSQGRQQRPHRHRTTLDDNDEVAFLGLFRRIADMDHRPPTLMGGGLGFLHRLTGQVFGRQPADVDVQIMGQNELIMPPLNNPLRDNPVNFNYQANGFNGRHPAPKPIHTPPAPPQPGFTRSTGEAVHVICPGCEEELKYDPDAAEDPGAPPAKKARTRKDREEHHFWAVKNCGHVFCKSCFENRKSTGKTSPRSNFRQDQKKYFCPVDECESEVTNKTAWVGIFL